MQHNVGETFVLMKSKKMSELGASKIKREDNDSKLMTVAKHPFTSHSKLKVPRISPELLQIYSEVFFNDVSDHIEKNVPETIRERLKVALEQNKTKLVQVHGEQFFNILLQHSRGMNRLNRVEIDELYRVWFTCFFNMRAFLSKMVPSVPYSTNQICANPDAKLRIEQVTFELKRTLISKYKTILSGNIRDYVNDYVGNRALTTAILQDEKLLENHVRTFVDSVAQLSDATVSELFKTWYDCYFNMFEYFKEVCRSKKQLLNQIDLLHDSRRCAMLNSKKRGRSFISEHRYKAEKQNTTQKPERVHSVPTKSIHRFDLFKHVDAVNREVFERARKFELKREISEIKPTSIQTPHIKPVSSIAKVYNRKYINDFATCFVVIAHVRSLRNAIPYPIGGILQLWYHYARFTRRILSEFQNERQEIQVLRLWQALKQEVTIYDKSKETKAYDLKNGIQYNAGSKNFLYDLIYNNGSLDCAGGTSMLYALVSNDGVHASDKRQVIDIRTVHSQLHTLIAIGDTWLLETTFEEPKLLTLVQYQKHFNISVYPNPQEQPNGVIDMCIALVEATSFFDVQENVYYDLLTMFGITKDKHVATQIHLFALLCKFNKSNCTTTEYTDTLKECLKNIPNADDELAYESLCLINVSIFQQFTLYQVIRNMWIKLWELFLKTKNNHIWLEQYDNIMEHHDRCLREIKTHNQTDHAKPIKVQKEEKDAIDVNCFDYPNR